MSKLTFEQIENIYQVPSKTYFIKLFSELDKKGFLQLSEIIRYYCNQDNISYLVGFSQTDSKTAKPKYEKTGKRGRPRKIIQGRKVDGHIHNAFTSTSGKSCRRTVLKISKAIDKKMGKNVTRIDSIRDNFGVYCYADYILKQSDFIRQGGEFNFEKYVRLHTNEF